MDKKPSNFRRAVLTQIDKPQHRPNHDDSTPVAKTRSGYKFPWGKAMPYLIILAMAVGFVGYRLYDRQQEKCYAPVGYSNFSGTVTDQNGKEVQVIRSLYLDGKGSSPNIFQQMFLSCGTPDGTLKSVDNYKVTFNNGSTLVLSKAVVNTNVMQGDSPLADQPQMGK